MSTAKNHAKKLRVKEDYAKEKQSQKKGEEGNSDFSFPTESMKEKKEFQKQKTQCIYEGDLIEHIGWGGKERKRVAERPRYLKQQEREKRREDEGPGRQGRHGIDFRKNGTCGLGL